MDEIPCCFIFGEVWELFCVSTSDKIIVRNSFSVAVYITCNISLSVSENFSPLLLRERESSSVYSLNSNGIDPDQTTQNGIS